MALRTETSDLQRSIIGLGLILLAMFIVYLPALGGSILWDDNDNITKPELRSVEGLPQIWLRLGATQTYYPLVHTLWWVEFQLWGEAPLGYHLATFALSFRGGLLPVFHSAAAADSRGPFGGGNFRIASCNGGVGCLGHRTKEHPFDGALS